MIDVFRIGVSIGMTNEVSPVIGTIQRDLAGLGKAVDRAAAGFGGMRLAAMGAAGASRMPGSLGLAAGARQVVRERAVTEAPAGAWRGVMEALGRVRGGPERRGPIAGPGVLPAPVRAGSLPLRNALVSVPPARERAALAPVAMRAVRRAETMPAALRSVPGAARWNSVPVTAPPRGGREGILAGPMVTSPSAPLPFPGGRMAARVLRPEGRTAPRGLGLPGFGDAVTKRLAALAGGLNSVGSALAADWKQRLPGRAGDGRGAGRAGTSEMGHGISGWRATERAVAGAGSAHVGAEPQRVIVLNPHDIGNATGMAVTRGMRVPAATTPSLPSPAAMPWAPGPVPVMP